MGDNISIRMNADSTKLVADIAVAKVAYKDFGKEVRVVSTEIARGDGTQETRARLLELSGQLEASERHLRSLEAALRQVRAEEAQAAGVTEVLAQGQSSASAAGRVLSQQLSQVSQQVMAGTSALQALAIQLPDIAVGMSNAGAQAGKFAAFLGSGLGVAVTVVASALIPLIDNLLETDDATSKAEGSTMTLAQAEVQLQDVQAADRSGDLARAANALADARTRQAEETIKAARAEAMLNYQAALKRQKDLADGDEDGKLVVHSGRLGHTVVADRKLDTQVTRAGSELSREQRKAELDVAKYKKEMDDQDARLASINNVRLRNSLQTDSSLQKSRLDLKTATDSVSAAEARRNIIEREAQLRIDATTTGTKARADAERAYVAQVRSADADLERARAAREKHASRDSRRSDGSKELGRKQKLDDQRDRQLSTGVAQTDLSVSRIGIGDKRAVAEGQFRDAMDTAHALKDPDASEQAAIAAIEARKAAAIQLAQEEAHAEIQAQEQKKQAYAGDVVAVQDVANQERLIRADLAAQLNEIERQHTRDVEEEHRRRAEAAERSANRELAEKRRMISEIEGYEDQLVSSIIQGRQSLGQIVGSIAMQMAQRQISAELHRFTEHAMLSEQELQQDGARAQGSFLRHLLGETKKSAATAAGTQTRTLSEMAGAGQSAAAAAIPVASHVAAEAAKTGATVVGEEARVAATAAGAAQSGAIVGAKNAKEIISHAATAAAAAYHAMAGIPVVGPILGAAAAAATFTAVTAYGALASFDKGTNALPNDMIAQIHAGERIVPAADNREMMAIMRAGASGGSAGGEGRGGGSGRGGDNYHLHYNPTVHGQLPFKDQLARHERNMFDMIQRGMRSGALRLT